MIRRVRRQFICITMAMLTTVTYNNLIYRAEQSAVSAFGQEIDARAVDSILQGRPATVIKMDVEGCEREALW